jgi:hypothetical protein
MLVVIVTLMTITWRYIASGNNYFDNKGDVYVQC